MKVIHRGVELPFELPIRATDIPEEFLAILPPLPTDDKEAWILAVSLATGRLHWVFDVYIDY